MGDNPVFKNDHLEMEESQRGNLSSEPGVDKKNDGFTTIDIRTHENEKKINNTVEEFDSHMSLRFKVLIAAIVIVLIWIIIHFGFIQDYSKSDMDM